MKHRKVTMDKLLFSMQDSNRDKVIELLAFNNIKQIKITNVKIYVSMIKTLNEG